MRNGSILVEQHRSGKRCRLPYQLNIGQRNPSIMENKVPDNSLLVSLEQDDVERRNLLELALREEENILRHVWTGHLNR